MLRVATKPDFQQPTLPRTSGERRELEPQRASANREASRRNQQSQPSKAQSSYPKAGCTISKLFAADNLSARRFTGTTVYPVSSLALPLLSLAAPRFARSRSSRGAAGAAVPASPPFGNDRCRVHGAAARHVVCLLGGTRALPWHPQQEQNRYPPVCAAPLWRRSL